MLPDADLLACYSGDWFKHRLLRLAGMIRRREWNEASRLANTILDERFPGRWRTR